MRFLFCYFSATKNTRRCVDEYVKNLTEHECVIHNIEDGRYQGDVSSFDKVFIAYPIHGFNAPENVLKFAKTFKKMDKSMPLIILKTSGEPLRINNISSYSLRHILKRRGFVLTNEYHYIMPYDIIFRHTDKMAYDMYETMKKLIPLDAKDILSDKHIYLKHMPFGLLIQKIMLIEHPGAHINGWFMHTNKNCVSCGLCEKKCPVKNITMKDGHVKFHAHCLMCTRCAFDCPKDAIVFGLFNGWRVNGAYSFKEPLHEEINHHKRYCKKAYKKYFENARLRIEASENDKA